MPVIERHGAVRAWIIDGSGFAKKGTQSVGVARQGSVANFRGGRAIPDDRMS